MDWDDMRIFLALCRDGSLAAAGKSLGVNHTTVARRIRALEKNIGTRLFDKSNDGFAMTQSAENMYSHALKMEENAHAIDRDVFGQDAELRGSLKLTVSHDFASNVIVPKLQEFRVTYPCIDLDVLTTKGLIDLAAREADIAVRLTNKPPDYLIGREVLPMRHGVYTTTRYLKRATTSTDIILFRGDDERPPWVEEHFQSSRVALRVDDVSTMIAAIRNHMGIARIPCYIGDADKRVRRLDLRLTPSTWGVWVLSHVDLRSTARVRVCREFLVDAIQSQRSLVLGECSKYVAAI